MQLSALGDSWQKKKKPNKPQNNTICRSPLSIVAFFFVDEGKTLLIENKYNFSKEHPLWI